MNRQRRPEGDEHACAKRLARLEGQAEGKEDEGLGPALFVLERDAGSAGLDPLNPRLGVGGAFRIDGDHVTAVEGGVAGGEGVHVAIHLVGIVLTAVHGDGTGCPEKAGQERIPEERGRGQVVHLAGEDGADQQRIDQVIGVIDAEEHGPVDGARVRDDARPRA